MILCRLLHYYIIRQLGLIVFLPGITYKHYHQLYSVYTCFSLPYCPRHLAFWMILSKCVILLKKWLCFFIFYSVHRHVSSNLVDQQALREILLTWLRNQVHQVNLLYSRIPRNIFSFFATHPRSQCLSLGEKGCLANTFGILFIVDSLCLSSKLKQLVLCQKVEQNCQTLFFIVVQRYLKLDISALVCKAMGVLLAPLFFEFLYLHCSGNCNIFTAIFH